MTNPTLNRPVESSDLHSQDYFRNPFPYWARMRQDQPVFHDTIANVWMVTRYEDVCRGYADDEALSNRSYQSNVDMIGPTLLSMDGNDHSERRAIVAPKFSGRRMEALSKSIRENSQRLISEWITDTSVDLVGSFTAVLPIAVIMDMVGLPMSDLQWVRTQYMALMDTFAGERELDYGKQAHQSICKYLSPFLDSAGQADLLSSLLSADVGGHRLTRDEVFSLMSLLLLAGGETTDHAMANMWWNILQDPYGAQVVQEDPELLQAAFSETMRRDGPVFSQDRIATTDVEWHGASVPAGARIRLCVASANNDPTVFTDPRQFKIDRNDLSLVLEHRNGLRAVDGRSGHLGFGLGKHFCLGWYLARQEAVIGSQQILEQVGDVKLVDKRAAPKFHRGRWAVDSLQISFKRWI